MNPIAAIKQYRQNRQHEDAAAVRKQKMQQRVDAFIAEVDTHVRVFRLNPELAEIQMIKDQAWEICSTPPPTMESLLLMWLNPYADVEYNNMRLTIHERLIGHVLRATSLVEFHLQPYDIQAIERIRVDGTGTHIFGWSGRELVHYWGGKFDPHRAADPGNRVENAIVMVNHFTGLDLDWQELWHMGLYWAEFTKGADGWTMELGAERPVNA